MELDHLTEEEKAKLQTVIDMHKRYSNITFLVRKVLPHAVKITTTQGKHLSENYAPKSRLVEITKEVFGPFVGDRRIHVVAITYFKTDNGHAIDTH